MTSTASEKRSKGPVKRIWQRPTATEYDTRAEITAYSGDRDLPWISR